MTVQERAIVAQLSALLPGTYYMDPPDGGSVTVVEQFRRMAQDAAKWREHAARTERAIACGEQTVLVPDQAGAA